MPKRAHDVVDLTGDDESETRQKRPATGSSSQRQHQSQSQSYPGQGGTSVYGGSSQNVPSSTAEPDYLDLTQDDEDPPLELYGTFRMSHSYVINHAMF